MIIGLSGYARTGKDTIADILVDKFSFTKASFAEPIREALVNLNPLINIGYERMPLDVAVEIYGWEQLKKEAPEIRGLLQRFGTEVGRNMLGQDIWVDQAFNKLNLTEDIVFTDVRFKNEANRIREHGGVICRVFRDDVHAINKHSSETEMDDYEFDTVIHNNQDLEWLEQHLSLVVTTSTFYTEQPTFF
jgi:deoxyadenosine/deoxycytidine kinase